MIRQAEGWLSPKEKVSLLQRLSAFIFAVIVGHLKNFEEKGNDSWIALSAFSKRNKEDKSLLENEPNYSDNSNYIITVRLSDVEYIEIY